MVADTQVLRAQSLDAALAALAAGSHTVLAGGTDLFASLLQSPTPRSVLDIGALDELRGWGPVSLDGRQTLRIGALATWSSLVRGGLPAWARALAQAGADVGGVQIQNRGTLGGNLCNASPAADSVPPLLALDAQVELRSKAGSRRLPVADFMLGVRRTDRRADELLTAVHLPVPDQGLHSAFAKLGHRRYLVISIVMVGLALAVAPDGRIATVRVAVGACGPAARRLERLEHRLVGLPAPLSAQQVLSCLDADALAALSPIDDLRGSAAYRLDAVRQLVARGLAELSREATA